MLAFDQFFAANYELVDVIKSSERNYIAVVYDKQAKHLCVMKKRALRLHELYKILKACDNPHVPHIYRLFEHEGNLIVIEEHIDGQTLEDMLTYQPDAFDETFVLNIFKQLCDCLTALHSVDIIHRDIKPSNIMIDNNNAVKLIDFGIARIFKPNSDADTEFLGTRGYAAPEQFGLFDLGQTDARTDIHALAVTVKRLLGEDYKGRLLPVLDRCTSLNPNDRYQSVAELIRAVDRTQKLRHIKRFTIIAALTVIIFILVQSINVETEIESPTVEMKNADEKNNPNKEMPIDNPKVEPPSTLDDEIKNPLIDFIKEPIVEPPPLLTIEQIAPSKPTYEIEKRPTMILYINGKISPNRSPHSTAGDIDLGDEYKSWRRDGKGNYLFPADWTAALRIENHTVKKIISPRITIGFWNAPDDAITIDCADIEVGQTVDIDIALADKIALKVLGADNIHGQIAIALESAGEEYPILIRDINVEP